MSIKSIRIKNIKGNTVNQELTGKDIFIGRNGSGKSTRLQSMIYAIMGYIPGKGKKEQETFKLSTSSEMSAGLTVGNFSFDRTIIRTEKVKADLSKDIKYTESLTVSPNKGEKNATQMNARIISEIGSFPIAFDFKEFLDLSDAKRRDFIYSLSPITNDDWDKSKVSEYLIKKLLKNGLKETNPDLYEATALSIENSLAEWPDEYDLTSGLQAMLSWVEVQQKAWNQKQGDAVGAVRELNDMKNQLEQTDRDIVAKKEELKDLRQQYTEVNGQIKAGYEIKRQWDQKQVRLSSLKAEIENLVLLLEKPNETDYERNIELLKEKIKTTDIAVESTEIQKQINSARFNMDAKIEELDEIKAKSLKISTELHTMDTVLKNIKEKGAGVCVIHQTITCDKDFSKFTSHVDVNGPKLRNELSELNIKRSEVEKDIQSFKDLETNLENKKNSLHQSFVEESKTNEKLRFEIEGIRKASQAAEQARQNNINKKILLQEEVIRLQEEKMPTFAPLAILEPQFASLDKLISELEIVIEEKEKAKITLSNTHTAMMSASKAQFHHTAAKNLAEALGPKGIQGELVKGILGPIEQAINENLQLMGIYHPVFFSTESETGKEVFQFGWVKDGRHTNFDVLSTGEQLMFLSAFLVTLLERANPPLKVLALDNIENLDKGNFINVMKGLNALSHKLDNILIAGVVDVDSVEGFTVWNLSPKVESDEF